MHARSETPKTGLTPRLVSGCVFAASMNPVLLTSSSAHGALSGALEAGGWAGDRRPPMETPVHQRHRARDR